MRNHIICRLKPDALQERPKVMSGLYPRTLAFLTLSFIFGFQFFAQPARSQVAGPKSYRVLSVKPEEIIVRIQPRYSSQTVRDSVGRAYTEMTFPGGILTDSTGAAEVMRLALPLLAPSRQPATVTIVSQSLEVLPGIDLAPVPTYRKKNGDLIKQYLIHEDRYNATAAGELFDISPVSRFRTAFSERILISPIQYDASSRSVTRVKSLTLRITFSDASNTAPNASAGVTISSQESEFFRTLFVNGTVTSFYTRGMVEWPSAIKASEAGKSLSVSPMDVEGSGQWLQITTTDEGIYRISAQDLANNGITGTIDPSTIELFGIGGAMLGSEVQTSLEGPTDSSGEWIQAPIDVRTNGGTVTDLYFYANGVSVWKYMQIDTDRLNGLYHNLNPYTSTGHFLLKVGGALLGQGLRVNTQADALQRTPIPSNEVLTAVCREVDRTLEIGVTGSNIGREMLDQAIIQGQPLQVSVDAPGYTGDSSIIRVAHDGQIDTADSGFVMVQINNQPVGTLPCRVGGSPSRDWDSTLVLDRGIQAPLNVSLTFTSSSVTANAWLDFIELAYRRNTAIGAQSIPFMLIDTGIAFEYQFTGASGGELWDVTNSLAPHIVASASSDIITALLQGQPHAMRRFIAFSAQSVLSPAIASLAAPSLRTSICQTGADEIIVAPQAFLTEANKLAALREEGGQATEAMSAAVVTIEQIYQEFGYGNSDIVALRDFMAYTQRHAQTRPLYLTLLGGGHCDYQNRQTSAPDYLPPWEYEPMTYPGGFRTGIGDPYPDDAFFVHLSDSEPAQQYDLAVGRISARNEADAKAYVAKVQEYEHGSDSGTWRSLGTFLADDHNDPEFSPPIDQLNHFADTQNEITHLQDRVLVHKVYEVSYPTVYASNGQRLKPEVNTAIMNAFNSGTVLFSFVGHGNPEVWTHESVLNVPSSIDQLTNFDRLAYVTTATCDFSRYDDFSVFSGGELFLMKPDGGAIGLLGTSRSVTSGEPLVQGFYQTLFQQDSGHGTSTVGEALVAGKSDGGDFVDFYLLGDPAQRLLLPKLYVTFDSINGSSLASDTLRVPALSKVRIAGSIRSDSSQGSAIDNSFNGTVTVTLFDTPTQVIATSTFLPDTSQWVDHYLIEGPILYSGTATVTNGQFTVSFIIPRDAKLDSGFATLSGYAYSGAEGRTALGDNAGIRLISPDSAQEAVQDTSGPALNVWLGSRSFQSGDDVSMHSTIIVDVTDLYGLNTSTASIGHSFTAWVDDAEGSAIDLSGSYVSKENDFTSGTSQQPIELPAGHHTLHVRAFNTYDYASFASVDFVAKNDLPYELYNISVVPDPLQDHTTFSFVQPGQAGSLVNVTLSIYDTDGRLVRTLTASSSESVIEIPWDGRDASETNVANGAYMFVVNAQDVGDGTSSFATGKCVVLR